MALKSIRGPGFFRAEAVDQSGTGVGTPAVNAIDAPCLK
jgi:hypothetical protein